jgi:sugar/nucleoside kinase (ribokinase family)
MRREDYIALVGFPARDTKRFLDGRVVESLGGVLHSALSLAELALPLGFDVVPICNVGTDVAVEFKRHLVGHGCRLDGVRTVDEPTQHSLIAFTTDDEREERISGCLPSLRPSDIAPWLTARALAVNFITGTELDFVGFRLIREWYHGPIIMDFHTLGLRTESSGRRVAQKRSDWGAWLSVPTIVQMNQAEAETLAECGLEDETDCRAFARDLLALGPKAVVITRAEQGAIGAWRGPRQFETYIVRAESASRIVDTVGCGDVFLAALTVGFTRWEALEPSMNLAVRAASAHATYDGLRSIDRLRDIGPR